MSEPIHIICVCKSGGDFDLDDVARLRRGVTKHTSRPFKFVCLTDMTRNTSLGQYPLRGSLPGWWSKIEAFRSRGATLYLDLDIVVTGSIDPLIDAVHGLGHKSVIMARDFLQLQSQWNSSLMGWNRSMVWMWDKFLAIPARGYVNKNDALRMQTRQREYRGDQDWIAEALAREGLRIEAAQAHLVGVYSYKADCLNGKPDDATLVCFHGPPRPRAVDPRPKWMEVSWREPSPKS